MREDGLSAVQRELQHRNAETTLLYAFSDLMIGKHSRGDLSEDNINKIVDRVVDKLLIFLNAR
jgi:uncharacterized metal-binding protein